MAITQNSIVFSNTNKIGKGTGIPLLKNGQESDMNADIADNISSEEFADIYGSIQSLNINWNGAQLGDKTLNTTGELLSYVSAASNKAYNHTHTNYASSTHNHDDKYAAKSHTHDGVYAPASHTHSNYATTTTVTALANRIATLEEYLKIPTSIDVSYTGEKNNAEWNTSSLVLTGRGSSIYLYGALTPTNTLLNGVDFKTTGDIVLLNNILNETKTISNNPVEVKGYALGTSKLTVCSSEVPSIKKEISVTVKEAEPTFIAIDGATDWLSYTGQRQAQFTVSYNTNMFAPSINWAAYKENTDTTISGADLSLVKSGNKVTVYLKTNKVTGIVRLVASVTAANKTLRSEVFITIDGGTTTPAPTNPTPTPTDTVTPDPTGPTPDPTGPTPDPTNNKKYVQYSVVWTDMDTWELNEDVISTLKKQVTGKYYNPGSTNAFTSSANTKGAISSAHILIDDEYKLTSVKLVKNGVTSNPTADAVLRYGNSVKDGYRYYTISGICSNGHVVEAQFDVCNNNDNNVGVPVQYSTATPGTTGTTTATPTSGSSSAPTSTPSNT